MHRRLRSLHYLRGETVRERTRVLHMLGRTGDWPLFGAEAPFGWFLNSEHICGTVLPRRSLESRFRLEVQVATHRATDFPRLWFFHYFVSVVVVRPRSRFKGLLLLVGLKIEVSVHCFGRRPFSDRICGLVSAGPGHVQLRFYFCTGAGAKFEVRSCVHECVEFVVVGSGTRLHLVFLFEGVFVARVASEREPSRIRMIQILSILEVVITRARLEISLLEINIFQPTSHRVR